MKFGSTIVYSGAGLTAQETILKPAQIKKIQYKHLNIASRSESNIIIIIIIINVLLLFAKKAYLKAGLQVTSALSGRE